MRLITRFFLALVAMILLCSAVIGAQTTDWTGDVFQRTTDPSRIAAAGIVSDAFLFYDYSAGTIELNDNLGGVIAGGTAEGQMSYWDNTTGQWDVTDEDDMYWDNDDGMLGIGDNASTYAGNAFLSVSEDNMTIPDTRIIGIISDINANDAATATNDLFAIAGWATFDDDGGANTMRSVYGGSFVSYMDTGTVTDLTGAFTGVDMDQGTATDIYGIYNQSDIAAGVTALTNAYGIYTLVDNDQDLTGSLWGQLVDVDQVLGGITGNLIGVSVDLDMTATDAANSIGLLNVGTYNGALTIDDDILGISNTVNLTAATLVTDDVIAASNIAVIGDDVGGDVESVYAGITQSAGTITGHHFNIYSSIDMNGGSTTDSIGIRNLQAYDAATVGDDVIGIMNTLDINSITITGAILGSWNESDIDDDIGGITSSYDYIVLDGDVTNDVFMHENQFMYADTFTIGDDFFGYHNSYSIAGDITDTYYGYYCGSTVTGDVGGDTFGIYIADDFQGTVTGTNYGIYIDEGTDYDYLIYQEDAAGTTHLEGSYESPWVELAMTNDGNVDLALPRGQNFRITGPTGAFNLEGLAAVGGNTDGRMITLWNTTAQNMTVEDEEGTSTAANRITSNTGGDQATVGIGSVRLIYDATTSRWLLVNFAP